MPSSRLVCAALAGGLLLAGLATPAAAHSGKPSPKPSKPPASEKLTDGMSQPLSVAIDHDGTAYITQGMFDESGMTGMLTQLKKGKRTDVVTVPGAEIAAASVRNGVVTYAESRTPSPEPGSEPDPNAPPPSALIKQIDRKGKTRTLVDLWAFEEKHNPDAGVTYGFQGISDACAAELPPEVGPATHPGIVESHPYASTTLPSGDVLVADAAANAVLKVSPKGRTSVVAVLPPAAVTVTADMAGQFGLPDCAVGLTYLAEPVPTDVEMGMDGMLYVTSLPGAPGEMGPNGSVFRVNPWNGSVKRVATGFVGATDLAVTPWGDIYVTELFGGQVSVLPRGSSQARTFFQADLPSAVEWQAGTLYVTTGGLMGPDGALLRFKAATPAHR
ncbi:ScyD/ScyE family protein [Georgenia thermotolerans]|uniref:ScyD/ScyE family protein n=1 Tax=Georgenia thermotolerans TaxID=527326 RepID=A0A7J5UQW8_9MICO|nr:ScyD/ScyE family protein [Georgenia thermotolerans]KAE8764739.1 ScyD/ScyE family protein [Georgenia thermotolerans]